MSPLAYRVYRLFASKPRDAYLDAMAESLYVRQLSENATMMAFLAWLTVLHFGANKASYPFLHLVPTDAEFDYRLTMTASAIIWASEIVSSWTARRLCRACVAAGTRDELTRTGRAALRPQRLRCPIHLRRASRGALGGDTDDCARRDGQCVAIRSIASMLSR